MSNLKHLSVDELKNEKASLEERMGVLRGKLNNYGERLKWVNIYLEQKTPQTMTMAEIERKLGHPVIITK